MRLEASHPFIQASPLKAENRELTILGRERRPQLHKTKTAVTEIRAVQLCRKHNFERPFIRIIGLVHF